MSPRQRSYYHATLWPAVCAAQGWAATDRDRRAKVTQEATGVPSTRDLDQHQITALFALCGHLAGYPAATATWHRIQRTSARAVNLQRQGEHHRAAAGYRAGGKADMGRFRKIGDDAIAPEMDEREAAQYAMTMRARAASARRRIATAAAADEIDCPY
jgi:hypothetical protein